MSDYLFTSESVSSGHPDKVADQISDAILDEILREDNTARVAVESLVKTDLIVVAGEVSTNARVDFESLARRVVTEIGYDNSEIGFDGKSAEVRVVNAIGCQSRDIAQGVDGDQAQGAGDQGLMFGFACDETPEYMPLPIMLAHQLMRRHQDLRREGALPWLRPDAKSQVTVRYQSGRPAGIDAVVLSTQHAEDIEIGELREIVREEIIAPIMAENGWSVPKPAHCHINPTGRFVIGGPVGDCGLTGRKIIVDTYGGMARHGGGAFSGKDPSKVDRSAAYAARHVAKNIVAAGLAKRCELQVSYAIGVAEPVSVKIDTFGTGSISEQEIQRRVERLFDLSPRGIIDRLGLLAPIYQQTAAYGHFGRGDLDLPWERCDMVDALQEVQIRGKAR